MGPEVALRATFATPIERPLILLVERAVVDWWNQQRPEWPWKGLTWVEHPGEAGEVSPDTVLACDPSSKPREVRPGEPDRQGTAAALAAIDLASEWALAGHVAALVTAPVSKAAIAELEPNFRGHTDHLARRAGLEVYGRDYLMTFLADDLRVALHSVHVPLWQALELVTTDSILDGLTCLGRHQPGAHIAVAGLNPHAGEAGLLGTEDGEIVAPAVEAARAKGLNVTGPWSPDTVFSRARAGEFDWVYALYHDQGLIAVKTLDFGSTINWTLGLPYLRVSVDHGTAFDIAGTGQADHQPMLRAIEVAAEMVDGG